MLITFQPLENLETNRKHRGRQEQLSDSDPICRARARQHAGVLVLYNLLEAKVILYINSSCSPHQELASPDCNPTVQNKQVYCMYGKETLQDKRPF